MNGQNIYYYILKSKDYINAGDKRNTFVKVLDEDLTDLLSKIRVPTLLLWGAEDRETPLWMGRMMHERIRRSKLKIYDGKGHGLPKFNPNFIVDDIVEFIKSI